ncbi:MAG: FKBP-type peptidyl-prolyl cis-trans isomerase [Bacteroidaceae bacterium]|nr:FKBP-type peptidyl-prolyl cis-trans isomerase [Bacteroidaceae bacterium]
MKKISLMALAAVAIMVSSCGDKTKANLNSNADTLAYAFGLSQAEGLKQAMMQNGIDSTMYEDFYKGLAEGAKMKADDKKQQAYMFGIQMGQVISQRMIPSLNQECYGADSTKTISLGNLMAGLWAGVKGEKTDMTVEQASVAVERIMKEMKTEANKELVDKANAFMKKFASNKEYKQLDNTGIYYKVIKEGNGEKPTAESTVKVHYEGKNMVDSIFDSSYQRNEPATMAVTQVIKGWQEVLKAMPVGSTWECVIPYELAYGEQAMGDKIPAFSPLVFKVELIGIEAAK